MSLLPGTSSVLLILPLKDELASLHNGLSKLLDEEFSFFVTTSIRLRLGFACTHQLVIAFGVLFLLERIVKRVPAGQLMLFEQWPELREVQLTGIDKLRWLRAVG